MDARLLGILRCPASRLPLAPLEDGLRERLNHAIAAGGLRYEGGEPVDRPLAEGLVTEDRSLVYRVDDGIPVMLAEYGIATKALSEL